MDCVGLASYEASSPDCKHIRVGAAKVVEIVASSADLFLGDLGSVSKKDAQRVFPLLERSIEDPMPNEQDWLLPSADHPETIRRSGRGTITRTEERSANA